ncbi:hypothetical protein [uncultured Pseudomonas sp.]|uniref:hypothetical protein n=1 Tax=uncultured Pseudomonas sp. TaxID=114707 RepID=UPI0025854D92|nr:hypothetical protein [uncultured Pseudomonas sp.]
MTTCESEKADKAKWHRKFRRAAKMDIEGSQFISFRQYGSTWCMGKDGKQYLLEASTRFPEYLRK